MPSTNVGNVTTLSGPFGGEGLSTFSVQAVGANGLTSAWATPCAITYDATAPVVTVKTQSTTDTTPTVTGTVNDNTATVSVVVDGHTYTATVASTANTGGTYDWSADVTHALSTGVYDVAATATDPAGNVGTDGTTDELTINAAAQQTSSNTTLSFSNFNTQVATTGNANSSGNTNGGGAQSGGATNTNSAVLGANTDGSSGKVKGDSTVNLQNAGTIKKDHNFASLGWWWLAIIGAFGATWFLIATKRRRQDG
ncbi:MAG: Ig-like domain-containing protein [Candidatus Saccharibacteria bacterium]